MSDRENPEKGDEEAKETDTRTESTSMEETKGQDTDLRTRGSDGRTDRRRERDPRSDTEKRENANQMRHELGESSEYPARTGVEDCYYYLKNGRCDFGLSCRFNHPPMRHEMVQPSPSPGAGDCRQYLQSGQCSYGPKCRFNHPPRRHGMVQPSPYPVRPQIPESSHVRDGMVQPGPYPVRLGAIDCIQYLRTGKCSYGPKCRYNHPPAPVLPQWVNRQNCKFFQKGNCKHGSGCKFTHSMSWDGAETMRQATTWGKKRHGAKSSTRPWKRERQAHDLKEQKQKKRKVENLRIGPTVQSGEGGIQTEQRLEIPENLNVNAQGNLQEQADMERQNREAQEKAQEERRLQIENERRQARLLLERMKPRVLTSNVDQLREALPDIGIDRKEGDGF